MSLPSLEYWVLFKGCYLFHDKIEGEFSDVRSLILEAIKVKSSIIKSVYKDLVVDVGNIAVYYQGSDSASKKKDGCLVEHDATLAESFVLGQKKAYFRMEHLRGEELALQGLHREGRLCSCPQWK